LEAVRTPILNPILAKSATFGMTALIDILEKEVRQAASREFA
jgi:hypothetical protein